MIFAIGTLPPKAIVPLAKRAKMPKILLNARAQAEGMSLWPRQLGNPILRSAETKKGYL
jgi:hypothetical protein